MQPERKKETRRCLSVSLETAALYVGTTLPNSDGLPTVRGKKFSYQKSAVRGKQESAQRGIFAGFSQRGNHVSAVRGKLVSK